MSKVPLTTGDVRKRANVDKVCSILENKGHDIISIAPQATVFEAISEMARKEVGALLVLAAQDLVGIITERDYARKVILQGRSSKTTRVEEIMTTSLITVTSELTVDECLWIITTRRIRHLPVVDSGVLRGMVSVGDLVRTMINSQAHTIDQLHTYIATDYPS